MHTFRSWGGPAVVLAMAVVSCSGGSNPPTVAHLGSSPTTTAAPPSGGPGPLSGADMAKMEAYSQCMRTHGVSSFPDPQSGPNGGGFAIRANSGSGLDPNSPTFQSADKACKDLLPNKGVPKPLTAAQQQAFLTWAACIRAHGIPNFQDPKFSGGGVQISLSGGAGLGGGKGPSLIFQAAQKACASKLPTGFGKLGG